MSIAVDGKPLDPARRYRAVINNFMAAGGDNFTVLAGGTDPIDAGLDLDATEAYLRSHPAAPVPDRTRDLTPTP